MGLCGSAEKAPELSPEEKARQKEEQNASRTIDDKNQKEFDQDHAIYKLLLLGAGESGKSTLFKQMIKIYGKGFDEDKRKTFVPIIFNNILTSIQTLLKEGERLDAELGGTSVSAENDGSKQAILELKANAPVTPDIAAQIKLLWADPGVQKTYSNRSKFQLTDSTDYFLSKVDEIASNGYIPSEQDVLRSRVRTTGIVENEFEIQGRKFKMFDVGGQRNERKKWIHCFENVTAVIFVAALSEYDLMLFEDRNVNRMHEAVTLFDEVCNSRWFKQTSMILFLNKRDLFEEKIKKVPLTVCYPEYSGKNDYKDASDFIKQKFETQNKTAEKVIYTHLTCATDTNNVAVVFNAVKDIVIRRAIVDTGM